MDANVKIDKIRNLLALQTYDVAWFTEAEQLTGISNPAGIELKQWELIFLNNDWGKIEYVDTPNNGKVLVWYRKDLSEPIGDLTDRPDPVKCTCLALMVELSRQIRNAGQTTFCRVGEGFEWMQATVILNGKEMKDVIAADALLGWVEFHVRDPLTGKLKLTEDNEHIQTSKVSGRVQILLKEQRQTFF